MLHRLLSRIGFDTATVDTIVLGETITRGQLLNGEIRLKGGQRTYRINHISLELESDASTFNPDQKISKKPVLLHHQNLAEQIELTADQELVIPFEFLIPYACPISWGQQEVKLHTRLALPWAIDPKDLDQLTILPDSTTQSLLDRFHELGWQDNEKTGFCTETDQSGHSKLVQVFALHHSNPNNLGPDFDAKIQSLNVLVLANAIGIEVQFNYPGALSGQVQWIDQAPHDISATHPVAWHLLHQDPITDTQVLNMLRAFMNTEAR